VSRVNADDHAVHVRGRMLYRLTRIARQAVLDPAREYPAGPRDLVGGQRRQKKVPNCLRSRRDRFPKALAVVLDEPHRPLDDRCRAAVVDGQVEALQAGQSLGQSDDPPHVGQAPRVDRLVVVPDEEDATLGTGEQDGQVELGAVDVLDLVHEEVPTPPAPAGQQVGVLPEQLVRPDDEVVEVEGAALGEGSLVGEEGGGDAGVEPAPRVPGARPGPSSWGLSRVARSPRLPRARLLAHARHLRDFGRPSA